MKKSRFIATILIVTMAFSVTACSSKSEKEEETTAATTSASTEAATEATTEAKASETQADDGTLDPAIVGTWALTVGEGEDQFTIYYTYNEDGTGKITYSDTSLTELTFTYTTPDADTLIFKSSESHSEEYKYKVDGDTLTEDDGLQETIYTRSK